MNICSRLAIARQPISREKQVGVTPLAVRSLGAAPVTLDNVEDSVVSMMMVIDRGDFLAEP